MSIANSRDDPVKHEESPFKRHGRGLIESPVKHNREAFSQSPKKKIAISIHGPPDDIQSGSGIVIETKNHPGKRSAVHDDDYIEETNSDCSPVNKPKAKRANLKQLMLTRGTKAPHPRAQLDPTLIGKGYPETYSQWREQ